MIKAIGSKDRRRYPRLFMDLPIEYQVLDVPDAYGGMVVNGSEVGLRIYSIKDLSVGTKLKIAVLFPKEFELTNFEVLAEIVWKEPCWTEEGEGYEYGLKFIQIGERDLLKLKQLLSEQFKLRGSQVTPEISVNKEPEF
jgi:hypothetical protein